MTSNPPDHWTAVLADQDQDWMSARKWWSAESVADKMSIWSAMNSTAKTLRQHDDTVLEIVSRFAILGFSELALREETAEPAGVDAENAGLKALFEEAIEFADQGWAYASDYFRDKWNYEETSKRLKDALEGAGDE